MITQGGDNMNKNLVAYRKLLGLNQSTMASKIGISLTSYSLKENGKFPFNQKEMIKIVQIIKEKYPDVTMDDIFFNNTVSKLKTNSIICG